MEEAAVETRVETAADLSCSTLETSLPASSTLVSVQLGTELPTVHETSESSASAAPAEEKLVASPTLPKWDDRPVATPTNSKRSCPISPGAPPLQARGVYVAEMWLRLARIALLELTKIPPPNRILHLGPPREAPRESPAGHCDSKDCDGSHHEPGAQHEPSTWMNMAFPDKTQFSITDDHGAPESGDVLEQPLDTTPVEPAMQAWMRIISRVLNVTSAVAETPVGVGPPVEPLSPSPSRSAEPSKMIGYPPGPGHANICLGDIMEESVTWIEVDYEDDVNSPKAIDHQQVCVVQEEDAEEVVPSGLKDVYRQQNAPGIVAGMQKCLSFC